MARVSNRGSAVGVQSVHPGTLWRVGAFDVSLADLTELLRSWGEPAYRGGQVYHLLAPCALDAHRPPEVRDGADRGVPRLPRRDGDRRRTPVPPADRGATGRAP